MSDARVWEITIPRGTGMVIHQTFSQAPEFDGRYV
jgi:hypothetical protein